MSENVERMGVKNAIVVSHTPDELEDQFPGYFDRILLFDAEGNHLKVVQCGSPRNLVSKNRSELYETGEEVTYYKGIFANENFIYLQDELTGTENRIGTARKDYNDAATDYNATIKKFPNVIFAGILGFEKAELYEALDTSQIAPIVNFD